MKLLYFLSFFSAFLFMDAQTFQNISSKNITSYLSANPENFTSKTVAVQIGDSNISKISVYNDSVGITQLGDYNQFYFNEGKNAESNLLNVTQLGNNNKIDVNGSNSISNGMSLKISGNDRTVIVNNYK